MTVDRLTLREEMLSLLEEEKDLAKLVSMNDFPLYAETNLKIQDVHSNLVLLRFNNVQSMLEEIWNDIDESNDGMIRLYILKARRFGVSTYVTSKFFWRTMTQVNHYSVVVTHEPQATDYLFKMQKRYYDNLQKEFQAIDKYNNMRKLELNTPAGDGLDSAIRVGTANVGDFGSAMMIHDLLMSESAKYPKGTQEELETSILQCVPRISGTAVVYESTAKGMGGSFYTGYWSCRTRYEMYLDAGGVAKWKKFINPNASPDNRYASVFIPAFIFYEYRAPVPEGFTRTAEEEKLAIEHNVPNEYLQWRRLTLENECRGDINKYHQEYPHTAREAFLSTGTPSFDVEKVLSGQELCKKFPPIARYECLLATGQWISRPEGDLIVWEEPRIGTPYLVSADVSEGLAHGDFSSVSVWNHLTGLQAAHAHFKPMPADLATFMFHLGNRYNKAWLAPERNNNGLEVVNRLYKDYGYEHLFVEKIPDPPNRPRKRYGWITTTKTRPLILSTLKYQVYHGATGIRCPETFEEMLYFRRQADGKEEADSGQFDDRVIDAAIGKYLVKALAPVVVEKPKARVTAATEVSAARKFAPQIVRRSGQRPDPKAFS